jgi:small subunit ribosomal protein S4
LKRPEPPGPSRKGGKRPRGGASEYAKQLRAKQEIRALYGIRERQFRNYVRGLILKQKTQTRSAAAEFLWALERRLDNMVYRMGFATSRSVARQLVSHGHIAVNGARVTIPAYSLRIGDVVQVHVISKSKTVFKNNTVHLEEYQIPSWLYVDKEKLEGKIVSLPNPEDEGDTANFQMIFEYYAR